jgi:hypothetical protein
LVGQCHQLNRSLAGAFLLLERHGDKAAAVISLTGHAGLAAAALTQEFLHGSTRKKNGWLEDHFPVFSVCFRGQLAAWVLLLITTTN